MFKNIIFDFGGVMVDFSPREFLVDHFFNESIENALYEITFGSDEWLLMDAGKLSRTDAYTIMRQKAAKIGRTYELNIVLEDWVDMLRTKEDTVRVAKRLQKAGFNLYYLSNMSQDVFQSIQSRKFFSMFQGGIVSYEVQLLKPDVRIYEALLQKYGLDARDCLFIDDSEENAAAAVHANISGIHFTSATRLSRTLENHGILTR